MFLKIFSDDIGLMIPYEAHLWVHLASIAWYFLIKSRAEKSRPATIRWMCGPAICITVVHALLMAINPAVPFNRNVLGLVINAGLLLMFWDRWMQARERVRS